MIMMWHKKLKKLLLITTKSKKLLIFAALSLILLCSVYWWLNEVHAAVSLPIKDNKPLDGVPNAARKEAAAVVEAGSNILEDDNLIVLYNRVPKTGSTSFVNIAYELCKRNKFHVLHINVTANMHVLSLPNQVTFVRNVTKWQEMKPALYHGHVAFLDFSKFQIAQKPIYINIIRKPLDRFVSYYYFLRSGDNYRPNLVRKKANDKKTFDECVKKQQPDCDAKNMWMQIPFFCGHAVECWKPGSEWALSQAKRNLVNEYFLVGVTEQLGDFVDLLEKSLPRIFQGFHEYYEHSNKSHLRQTSWKIAPSNNTVQAIMKTTIWKMENELYEFALAQFEFNKLKLTVPDKGHLQKFMYEKIRPK